MRSHDSRRVRKRCARRDLVFGKDHRGNGVAVKRVKELERIRIVAGGNFFVDEGEHLGIGGKAARAVAVVVEIGRIGRLVADQIGVIIVGVVDVFGILVKGACLKARVGFGRVDGVVEFDLFYFTCDIHEYALVVARRVADQAMVEPGRKVERGGSRTALRRRDRFAVRGDAAVRLDRDARAVQEGHARACVIARGRDREDPAAKRGRFAVLRRVGDRRAVKDGRGEIISCLRFAVDLDRKRAGKTIGGDERFGEQDHLAAAGQGVDRHGETDGKRLSARQIDVQGLGAADAAGVLSVRVNAAHHAAARDGHGGAAADRTGVDRAAVHVAVDIAAVDVHDGIAGHAAGQTAARGVVGARGIGDRRMDIGGVVVDLAAVDLKIGIAVHRSAAAARCQIDADPAAVHHDVGIAVERTGMSAGIEILIDERVVTDGDINVAGGRDVRPAGGAVDVLIDPRSAVKIEVNVAGKGVGRAARAAAAALDARAACGIRHDRVAADVDGRAALKVAHKAAAGEHIVHVAAEEVDERVALERTV